MNLEFKEKVMGEKFVMPFYYTLGGIGVLILGSVLVTLVKHAT